MNENGQKLKITIIKIFFIKIENLKININIRGNLKLAINEKLNFLNNFYIGNWISQKVVRFPKILGNHYKNFLNIILLFNFIIFIIKFKKIISINKLINFLNYLDQWIKSMSSLIIIKI
jgi:hypothetical protein